MKLITIAVLLIFPTSCYCGIFDDVEPENLAYWKNEFKGEYYGLFCLANRSTTTTTTTTTSSSTTSFEESMKKPRLEMCNDAVFVCHKQSTCIPAHLECDKFVDCPDSSDEAHCNQSQWVNYHSSSRYEFLPFQGQELTFYVEAPGNVHIAFTEDMEEKPPILEVLIGESGGSKCEIRYNKETKAEIIRDGILDVSEYKKFTIRFPNLRQVFVEHYENNGQPVIFLSKNLPIEASRFKYFGFTTNGIVGKFRFQVQEQWRTHHTSSDIKYHFVPLRNDRFQFRVKVAHDCLLLLSPNTAVNGDDPRLRIIIGGWRGTKSMIKFMNGGELFVKNTPSIVNENNFKEFLVALSVKADETHGEHSPKLVTAVRVYEGNSSEPFLHVKLDRVYNFKYIGYSTGWEASGSWQIYDYPEATAVSRPPKVEKHKSSGTGLSVGAKVGIAVGSIALLGVLSILTFGIAGALGGAAESVALVGVESGALVESEAAIGTIAADTGIELGAEEGTFAISSQIESEAEIGIEETILESETTPLLSSPTEVSGLEQFGNVFTQSFEQFSTNSGVQYLQGLGSRFSSDILRRFTLFTNRFMSATESTGFSVLPKVKLARNALRDEENCFAWEMSGSPVECKAICSGHEVTVYSSKSNDQCLNIPSDETCRISKCNLGEEEYNRTALRNLVHPLEDGAVSPLGHIQFLKSEEEVARKILKSFWSIYFPQYLYLPHRTRSELVVQCVLMLFAYGYRGIVVQVANTLQLHEIEELSTRINQIKKSEYFPSTDVILEKKTKLLNDIQQDFGFNCAEFINEALQSKASVSSSYSDSARCQYEFESIAKGLYSLEFPLYNFNALHSSLILFSSLMSLAIKKSIRHQTFDVQACRNIFVGLNNNSFPGYEVNYIWNGVSRELKRNIISFSCSLYKDWSLKSINKDIQNILEYNSTFFAFQYLFHRKLHREMFIYHKPLKHEQLPLVQILMYFKLSLFQISISCIDAVNEFHYTYTGRMINCQSDEGCIHFVILVYGLLNLRKANRDENIEICLNQLTKFNYFRLENLYRTREALKQDPNRPVSEDTYNNLYSYLDKSEVRHCFTNIGYLMGTKRNYDRNCKLNVNTLTEFSYDLAYFLYKILNTNEYAISEQEKYQYAIVFKRLVYGIFQFLKFHGELSVDSMYLFNYYERISEEEGCDQIVDFFLRFTSPVDDPNNYGGSFESLFPISANLITVLQASSPCLTRKNYTEMFQRSVSEITANIENCYGSEEWQTVLSFYEKFDNIYFYDNQIFSNMGVSLYCAIQGMKNGFTHRTNECTSWVITMSVESLLIIFSIFYQTSTDCYIQFFIQMFQAYQYKRDHPSSHFCTLALDRLKICDLYVQ